MDVGDNKMYTFRSSRTKLQQVSERHQHEAPLDELEPDHGGIIIRIFGNFMRSVLMMANFSRIRLR